ncbi:MAG: DUF6089 family protein [Imperialibacter sp.]|uniref:DUF6089 family protein n=1 Tax=Imperialibacter sp. TaxID=2038411 RepID=UPI0030D6E6AC|tara:strand:+ start:4066 stop:5160 length:1095 start_codon:yes stop_codon:yes gene_type:complete
MKKFILVLIILVPALLASEDAFGQYKRRSKARLQRNKAMTSYRGGRISGGVSRFKSYHSLGVNLNASNYFGDIAPLSRAVSTDISFTRPGFGITHTYRAHKMVGIRSSFNWVRLKSDDFDSADPTLMESLPRYTRNLSFRNDVKELSVILEMDIFPNEGGAGSRLPFAPYVFAGGAAFLHNPKGLAPELGNDGNPLAEAGKWVSLRDLGTEGQNSDQYDIKPYKTLSYAIPFGIGSRFRLPGPFDAAFEIGYRLLFFDYIDDLSGRYVDPGAFGTNELARTMADRSREATSASGQPRQLTLVTEAYGGTSTKVSQIDGQPYPTIAGWGFEDDIRGNPNNNDQYIVTQIRLMYVFGKVRRSAKFR